MPDPDEQDARPVPRVRPWMVSRWPMWEMPGRLATSVVLVEVTALALVLVSLTGRPVPSSTDLLHVLALGALGITHTEIAVGVERVRRRVTEANHVDLSSVWTFAAAVILPPACAAAVAVLVHTHLWWRSGRPRVLLYRQVFTTSTIVLACVAASAVMAYAGSGVSLVLGGGAELVALVVALLAYTTVNSGLVAGAIAISNPQPDLTKVFGHWDDNLLEVATLSLGALAAVALAINPWLVLMVLPPLLVLHRAVLVRHLEEAATTDGKTGLLNAAEWHSRAERELRGAASTDGPRAVLVLDLDHFKAVNDSHGHIAGDHVLAAVADALRTEVRDRDLVGRFGGEEFVVLLAGLEGGGTAELEAVAERIRRRVAALRVEIPTPDGPLTIAGLSVSVGGAVHTGEGGDLRALLQIADAALYAAKRAGRNVVRMGVALPAQQPTSLPYADALLTERDGAVVQDHPDERSRPP